MNIVELCKGEDRICELFKGEQPSFAGQREGDPATDFVYNSKISAMELLNRETGLAIVSTDEQLSFAKENLV